MLKDLKLIIEKESEKLVNLWIENFDDLEEKEDQARYYDDFLGFFEECVERDLDIHSPETEALKMFLEKLIELMGQDKFFNFKDSFILVI